MSEKPAMRIKNIDRLHMLRNDIRRHNPESENVQVMNWAIIVIEKLAKYDRDLRELASLANE